ncbi:MAG: hypothetical protein WC229_03085 [Candidatus Paceibacterota bacterium]|jgi:hypothetical protein
MAKKKGDVEEKGDVKEEGEETEEKSSGLLSDDALEAFDDASPTGLEEEELLAGEDDELEELDFRTNDEW